MGKNKYSHFKVSKVPRTSEYKYKKSFRCLPSQQIGIQGIKRLELSVTSRLPSSPF